MITKTPIPVFQVVVASKAKVVKDIAETIAARTKLFEVPRASTQDPAIQPE